MKVWVVVGGERYDDYTGTIGVCATKELAEELVDRENAWPDRWATVHEEELITELPEWTPPGELLTYETMFDPKANAIIVWTEREFGDEDRFPICEQASENGGAFGTDRDAVIAYTRAWAGERGFRNVKVV